MPLGPDGRPAASFLRYSNDWRNGVRQFQGDLAAGRYEEEWLEEAAEAMEERAQGAFDDYKERHFEEYWGQKGAVEAEVSATELAKVSLEDLVRAGKVVRGDVWSYSRAFGRGKKGVLVEKEVEVGFSLARGW